MKMEKIRKMSSPDLEKEVDELVNELFKLKFSGATMGLSLIHISEPTRRTQ